jgi:hypothetical protein
VDFNYFDYTIRQLEKEKEVLKRLIHSVMTEDIEVHELRQCLRSLDQGIEELKKIRKQREENLKKK